MRLFATLPAEITEIKEEAGRLFVVAGSRLYEIDHAGRVTEVLGVWQ